MRRTNRIAILALGLSFLMGAAGAHRADAHADCNTRRKCGWLFKKYTANANTGCLPIPFPICIHHSGSCGTAAELCADTCLRGQAFASAINSHLGCDLTMNHTGLGFAGNVAGAGDAPDGRLTKDEQGAGHVLVLSDFDERTRTVTVNLTDGSLSALIGGQPMRVEVFVYRDDTLEIEGANPEPVRTRENTLWQGYVQLQDGRISGQGFDTRSVRVETVDTGVTYAKFASLQTSIPLVVSADEFDRLVVQAIETEIPDPAFETGK